MQFDSDSLYLETLFSLYRGYKGSLQYVLYDVSQTLGIVCGSVCGYDMDVQHLGDSGCQQFSKTYFVFNRVG